MAFALDSIYRMDREYDHLFKILIVGDSTVGKTSVLVRYVDDVFNSEFQTTIGVDFKVSTLQIEGKIVKLQLWDTAGQDRYRNIVSSYYRGAHGVILMFDLTSPETFSRVEEWYEESQKYLATQIPRLIIGNKSDLKTERAVAREDAIDLATRFGMQYIETSAKDNSNVSEAIGLLAKQIIAKSPGKGVDDRERPKLETGQKVKKACCS